MEVNFKKTKENDCYKNYVEHPEDHAAFRKFCKTYSKEIASEAVKVHNRLTNSTSALSYNQIWGLTDNSIEKKQGGKDKDPLILKTRVTGSYRKFFYVFKTETEFLLKKEWHGQFEDVTHIWVLAINNHDYNI